MEEEVDDGQGGLREEEEGADSDIHADGAASDAALDSSANRRLRRHSQARQLPLLCPQVSCSSERQFRLLNDCCTYCTGFDFCAHNLHHQCHADAFCINVPPNALNLSASNEPLQAAATFTCHCKTGFTGDGRLQCRDVDECAQRKLNHCDPRTTHCLNQPGGYQCTCRRGFRPVVGADEAGGTGSAIDSGLGDSSAPRTATPTSKVWTVSEVRRCEDVNECADGKLNRCHPQAKCINLRGSYKCRCRRGYLGNGFECHKWFSSDQNVAAYLHRHGKQPSLRANNNGSDNNAAVVVVNEPLGSLSDPDDDQVDDDEKATESSSELDDEDAAELDEESGSLKQEDDVPLSKLSESRWEPLLSESTSMQPQQVSGPRLESSVYSIREHADCISLS